MEGYLLDGLRSGDVLITLGAGDGYLVGERVSGSATGACGMSGLTQYRDAMHAAGYGDRIAACVSMAQYTSFGVGGPADLLATAQHQHELVEWVRLAQSAGVPYLVLGSGTNVLVSDRGIRGVVIINACQHHVCGADGVLTAESGCAFCELARDMVQQGWGWSGMGGWHPWNPGRGGGG